MNARPKRKGRLGLIVVCSLGLASYLFRHDLLVAGFDLFLKGKVSKNFSRPITYERVNWEEGQLIAYGLNLADEHFHLTIDRLEIETSIDWSKLYLETKLHVIHPELTIVHQQEGGTIPLTIGPMVPGKFGGVKLEIQNGVLQLNALDVEQRLYFSFTGGVEREQLGTLYLSYDPNLFVLPTTELSFALEGEEVVAALKVGQMESYRLMQLMSFFYPVLRDGWENVQGEIAVMASGTFSPDFKVSRLAGLIDASDLFLSNTALGIQAQAKGLHGEFTFPPHEESKTNLPFWKQVRASATVEEGVWILGDGGLTSINAHLLLDPKLDPVFDLNGTWIKSSKEVPLTMKGKGSVHEDQSFWLELGVKMTPPEEQDSEAFVSICSSEKDSYVVQVELNHLDVALFNMLGMSLPLSKGTAQGKLTTWIEGKGISKVQVDDLKGHNFEWALPEIGASCVAGLVQGEALFARSHKGSWQILSLSGEIPEARIVGEWTSPPFKTTLNGVENIFTAHLTEGKEEVEVNFDFIKNEGWLRSELLTETSFAPWLKQLAPELHAEGQFEVFGTFNSEKLFLSIQGKQLLLDLPLMAFHLEEMQAPALFTYGMSDHKWQGALSLQNANFIEKEHQLHFEGVNASCEIEGKQLTLKEISAQCEGIKFLGAADVDVESEQFSLTSTHIEGSLAPLSKFLSWPVPVQGKFIATGDGLSLVSQKGNLEWCLKAHLQELEMGLKEDLAFEQGECDLSFESRSNLLQLTGMQAQLLYKGKPYQLIAQAKKKEWWEFDARVVDMNKEVARAAGVAQERPVSELHFAFEKNKTHIFGMKVSVNRFIVKDWTELLALEMNPTLSLEQLGSALGSLHEAGLVPFGTLPCQMQGDLMMHLAYEDEFSFELTAPSLTIEGRPFTKCALKGRHTDGRWTIEDLSTSEFTAGASLMQKTDGLCLETLTAGNDEFFLEIDGDYSFASSTFQGQLRKLQIDKPDLMAKAIGEFSFDLPARAVTGEVNLSFETPTFQAQSGGKAHMSYLADTGLVLEGLDLFIQNKESEMATATCLAGLIAYDGEKWQFKKTGLHLTPEFASKIAPACDGWMPLSGQLEGEYTPDAQILKVGCKTNLHEQPIYLQIQIDHSEEVLGMLKISDDVKKPGVKCLFKSDLQWESVQGELAGLTFNLSKTAPETLWGTVAFDLTEVAKFLPKDKRQTLEKLAMGPGCELEGEWDLDLFRFKGTLKGKEFSLMGLRFHEMQGALTLSEEECLIENMTLDDPAVHVLVKQALVTHNGGWDLEAPLVLIQDFQPSKLRKTVAAPQVIKPLIIKKLSLYDLEGVLGEANSFHGRGQLSFTNAFKKEFNLLEIPLDLIKGIGLDPGLFTPIYGEAEFQLQNGRFLVTDLINTYSEGRRSEFYLPETEASYLDFDGNISLNLRMKQNVWLNITEPFTLTVRGNLEKPKYNLVR